MLAFGFVTGAVASEPMTAGRHQRRARTPEGEFIFWREHRIDDEDINERDPWGDGIAIGDIDGDGLRI